MEEKSKHRLVGAIVLFSLAIIFLPSLIYRDDTTTEIVVRSQEPIPPAPVVEPIEIPPMPEPPTPVEPAKPIFEPAEPIVESEGEAEVEKTTPAPSPRLTETGVPEGWLIQVASLSLKEGADVLVSRLKADNYSAYWELAETEQGDRYRVFVGPQIDKQRAERAKAAIDASYKVSSRLLRFNPAAGD